MQAACRPFQAVRRPAQLHASRRARLACSAAAEGWWRAGEQHWTFVDSAEQLQQVVDGAPNLVLVDCYTPWCGGCKMISPNLTRMAAEKDLQKICTFVKVDTDKMRDWASSESIKTLPYLAFFRRGEGRLVGMQMTPQKLKLLRKAIATLAENRGKSFRLDPNGFIIPVEPVAA
jgi:thioredoxin 1